MIAILDGAMGTELLARGVAMPALLWSAWALIHAPAEVAAVHRAYAAAGATVHTANTFRTKRRQAGDRWEELARRAVALARGAVPNGQKVVGSIAPLEDCYRPDLSPKEARAEHRELCRVLADAGVDALLCETFPDVDEGLVAVEEAVATGLPTWASFTAGPSGDLLTPADVERGAREAIARGAGRVLVNCVPATRTIEYVERLAKMGAPFGAYANAGSFEEGIGWGAGDRGAEVYAELARLWVEAGATLIGGCCGTGALHIGALARRFCGSGSGSSE